MAYKLPRGGQSEHGDGMHFRRVVDRGIALAIPLKMYLMAIKVLILKKIRLEVVIKKIYDSGVAQKGD